MATSKQREAAKRNEAEARPLGINGRSKKGKDELKRAVARAK